MFASLNLAGGVFTERLNLSSHIFDCREELGCQTFSLLLPGIAILAVPGNLKLFFQSLGPLKRPLVISVQFLVVGTDREVLL